MNAVDPAELKRIAGKPVLTTGDVGKVCGVAPGTAKKWIESGLLKGYEVPGGGHRRVLREVLVAFLREHGMPLGPFAEVAAAT